MSVSPIRPMLLVPRERPRRSLDLASRQAIIARQKSPARRRRFARRSLRALARVLALGLCLAALAVTGMAVGHWLRTAPLFAVRTVEVQGARRLSRATVLAAAGIEPGANLLALDREAIEDRVEALPGVRLARVVRRLPNRVAVVLEEREPYTLVNVAGGSPESRLHWIDAVGHLVGPGGRPGVPPLPILSGVEPPAPEVDRPVGDRLGAGLALLRAVQRAGSRVSARISEIDVSHPNDPVLFTVDGAEVWVGPDAWDERLARLDAVLGELDGRGEGVEGVDLRFRDQVVLRLRAAGPVGAAVRAGGAGPRRSTTTPNLVERP